MHVFAQDLRQAARRLGQSPGFTLAAAAMLALGIGATTTIFSFIYGILLKPLPYGEPDRIVVLFETSERARKVFGIDKIPVSPAMALEWSARARSFESIGMFRGTQANLGAATQPERIRGAWITGGALRTMGVKPVLGRLFEDSGRDDVVILGERLWRNHFGGRASIVGQTVRLDDKPLTVVGVMPQSFAFPRGFELAHDRRVIEAPNFWRPLVLSAAERTNYGNHNTSVVGLLKPGVTPAQSQSELSSISAGVYAQAAPSAASEFGVSATRYHENLVANSRDSLLLLGGCVLLVLLIACANVAGLLMVNAAGRRKEMAVRASLGASPRRLIGQVLTESALLSLVGGLAGTLLSLWGIHSMRRMAGSRLVRLESVSLDGVSLAFAVAASVLTAVVFGLAPAFFATRVNLSESLKEGGRTSTGGGHRRFRSGLVIAQMAFSMALLSAAGLLARSFYTLLQSDPGFQAPGVVTMRVPLPGYRYRTGEARQAFFHRLLEETAALPGVESAGVINQLPLTGEANVHTITVEGMQLKPGEEPVAEVRLTTPGYFPALKIPLRAGRWLDASDTTSSPAVAVINETMARRFWPRENALGKRFRLGGGNTELPWMTVVGIAADSRQASLEKSITPQVFRPFSQDSQNDMCLVVRTRTAPDLAAPALRGIVRVLDPQQPLLDVKTFEDVLEDSVAARRLQTWVLGAFALYALILAAAGLHGVVAYSVTQRAREFGVRAALGARREQLLGMVLREGTTLAAAGLAAGLAAALALGRFLSGFLYGVKPGDAATLSAVGLLLLAAATGAALLPAWRASRVDPAMALRNN